MSNQETLAQYRAIADEISGGSNAGDELKESGYALSYVNRSAAQIFQGDRYDELLRELEVFSASEGWLCFQSVVHFVASAHDMKNLPNDAGRLLSGELVNDRRTLTIEQHNDSWSVATVEELSLGDQEGDEYISRIEWMMLAEQFKDQDKRAKYRVYYRQGESGYEPFFYQFLGYKLMEARASK